MLASTAWLLLAATLAMPQEPGRAADRIEWQRTLADALAVQEATGLPLLVAVNMDGEVFNDRFAGTTYKDPKFVAATRGYVCVVASMDRHTAADHDASGRRIECPRFPGCTCGEHMRIEPELFARWFRGTRNAPRHLGVAKDGRVLFDRYLDASMQTAIDAIHAHRGTPPSGAAPPTALPALFARRDAASRSALEQRFLAADAAGRRTILAAAKAATNEPFDLLRMALHDPDAEVATLAAAALAQVATSAARPELEFALARVEDAAVVAAVAERLAAIGRGDPAAMRLAAHVAAAAAPAPVPAPWSGPWRPPQFAAGDRDAIEAALDRLEAQVRAAPGDEAARLELAIAQAALADVLIAEGGRRIDLWFADSRGNGEKVRSPALQHEAHALLAHVAYMTGDAAAAARFTALAQAAPAGARAPDPWLAARLLELALLGTVNGAYAAGEAARHQQLGIEVQRAIGLLDLLQQRGGGKELPLLAGIGLLEFTGLRREARQRLGRLLEAFPDSARAHEQWRQRLLADLGAEGLRQAYGRFADRAGATAAASRFAGEAALLAAEQHLRDRRNDVARQAYDEAIERLARCADGDEAMLDAAHHAAVLALAGRANLRFDAGDAAGAVADLLRAAELRPESLDESDGLLRKPRAIAGRIARDLAAKGQAELAAKLQPIAP
ncbi:MAG: hypothetical protein KF830_06525 [Planctomycetes bacterium]|nr:hypothetical protein [Planctomycetota bacterium]